MPRGRKPKDTKVAYEHSDNSAYREIREDSNVLSDDNVLDHPIPVGERYFRYNGDTMFSQSSLFVPKMCYKESDLSGTGITLDSLLKKKKKVREDRWNGFSGVVKDERNQPYVVSKDTLTFYTSLISYNAISRRDADNLKVTTPVYGIPHKTVTVAELITRDEYLMAQGAYQRSLMASNEAKSGMKKYRVED